MAAIYEIRCICEIFRDRSTRDKFRLVSVDELWDKFLEPVSQKLGNGFNWTILEGNRSKVFRCPGALFLWQKD
jgi:hypothetical protein